MLNGTPNQFSLTRVASSIWRTPKKQFLAINIKQLRSFAHQTFRRFGVDVRSYRSPAPSIVFDDPYEALLAESNQVIFNVPIALCTDKLGFSYGGWQPWAETVGQLRLSPRLSYEETVSKAFYSKWSFSLLREVFGGKTPPGKVTNHLLKVFHGYFLPFSPNSGRELAEAVRIATGYLFSDNRNAGFDLSVEESLNEDGTWSCRKGAIELHRLKVLLDSIQRSGYRRNDLPDGDIAGYLLRDDQCLRFVVVRGLHRAAVLSALHPGTLAVRLLSPLIIESNSVASWPLVKAGVWSRDQALRYFHHLFEFDVVSWLRGNGFVESGASSKVPVSEDATTSLFHGVSAA